MYMPDPLIQLRTGLRNGWASDAHKLKLITGALLSTTKRTIGLSPTKRAGWGFNDDNMGRMLIPVEYIEEYNDDPVWWVLKAFPLHT